MHPKLVTFLVVFVLVMTPSCISAENARPASVNVGALVAYNTTIGKVAKRAIQMALEDVNRNASVLNGTRLVLTMMDSNCSAFIGTAAEGNAIPSCLFSPINQKTVGKSKSPSDQKLHLQGCRKEGIVKIIYPKTCLQLIPNWPTIWIVLDRPGARACNASGSL
eukprot:Gb_20693 [translate_table: standard]